MNKKLTEAVLLGVLCLGLPLTACAGPPQPDVSGTTESEALEMTLEEQYELASQRHQELNECFAELQNEVYTDEWIEGGVRSEIVPSSGYSLNKLRGTTRDNTYYFTITRTHAVTEEEPQIVIRRIAEQWRTRGWEVAEETLFTDEIAITTTTDDGYWFEAVEWPRKIEMSGHSPVYWGDYNPLTDEIAGKRATLDHMGEHWDTTDRDENGYAYRLPGVYRPLPPWNTPTTEWSILDDYGE